LAKYIDQIVICSI